MKQPIRTLLPLVLITTASSFAGDGPVTDTNRLQLQRDMQFSRTQAHMIEQEAAPINEAVRLINEAVTERQTGNVHAAADLQVQAYQQFEAAYPAVRAGLESLGQSLLGMYSSSYGDPDVAADKRRRLQVLARAKASELVAARATGDGFRSKMLELQARRLRLELEGVKALGRGEGGLAKIRGGIERAVLINQKRLLELEYARLTLETVATLAGIGRVPGVDLDFSELGPDRLWAVLDDTIEDLTLSDEDFESDPILSSDPNHADDGFENWIAANTETQEH
ncbi:MAG: hypothetical protein QGI75_07520 [Phycisphaerales bacterium]|jgi:hypothetical protein|nr:hypothetical protein [Phycisphaerales bacterium]